MALDFLSAVLPTTGKYCVFTLRNGKPFKQVFVDDLDNLYSTALNFSEQRLNVFHALANFDDTGSREAESARSMRALFLDLDCGKEWVPEKVVNDEVREAHWKQKAFASKRTAVEMLVDFLAKTGLDALGTPWLVDSGGGVHVYFPLSEDAPIAAWQPVAVAMKRAAKLFEFPIDEKVTSDAARVLRTPGTKNWKYGEPKDVTLRQRGDTFDLQAIADCLSRHVTAPAPKAASTAVMIPGKRPGGELSAVAKALAGNSSTLFKNIMVRTAQGTGCQQLNHYIDNASDDGMEPVWRAWLSIAKYCDDGAKAARILSNMHPYDFDRMQTKLDAIKGPYSCLAIESENEGGCEGCPHKGKITNPLMLGRVMNTVAEETVMYKQDTITSKQITYTRPTPPPRFSYGEESGIFYTTVPTKKGEEAQTLMILPFDFYMTRMFRDGQIYQAEFKAVKGLFQFTFAVPTSVATSQSECIKTLAANNVIAAHFGYDPYLYQYVRQSMMQASAEGNEVVVPPNFGWQKDGNFAFGDTVYSANGPAENYTYVSDRLSNVIRAVEPAGDIEEWKKVIHLLRRKQLWGHLTIGLTSFASLLMHFMPAGSRAVTVHVCGKDSGMGKTFAMAVANSACGLHENYVVPPATSKNTLLQRAGFFGSCHSAVDEITNLQHASEREFMPQLIFDYSQGQHKLKGSATGNAEIAQELFWEGILLTSANTPVLEPMMGARAVTSEGEARRVLEWNLPDGYKLVWGPGEQEISQLIKENYGHALRVFAQWLVVNQDLAREVSLSAYAEWRKYASATDDERFWSSGAGAYIAAAILLGPKYANVVPVPWEYVMSFLLDDVVRPARAIINANQSHAMDILNAYIRENNQHFIQVEGSVVMQNLTGNNFAITPNSDRRLVRGRVERNVIPGTEDLFIETKMLKMHCAALNRGYSAFIKELATVATVTETRRDLLAGTKGPTMRVPVVRVSRPI